MLLKDEKELTLSQIQNRVESSTADAIFHIRRIRTFQSYQSFLDFKPSYSKTVLELQALQEIIETTPLIRHHRTTIQALRSRIKYFIQYIGKEFRSKERELRAKESASATLSAAKKNNSSIAKLIAKYMISEAIKLNKANPPLSGEVTDASSSVSRVPIGAFISSKTITNAISDEIERIDFLEGMDHSI